MIGTLCLLIRNIGPPPNVFSNKGVNILPWNHKLCRCILSHKKHVSNKNLSQIWRRKWCDHLRKVWGAFRRTKNTSQIKICPKFEGGYGLIIWERFSDQSIKNLICQVFVGFPWQICDFSLPFLKLFLVFDFRQRNLVKENVNLWQISLFFVRLNAL